MSLIQNRISVFLPQAMTQVRLLQAQLIDEYDPKGYQSEVSEDLLLKITETNDFISLLNTDGYCGMTDREISDTIDFFIKWLGLNEVITANYQNYFMPVVINSGTSGQTGDFATVQQLNQEINNRIAVDNSLNVRITALENAAAEPIFPPGFFNNYAGTYTVVFDDDTRLHTHNNLPILQQIVQGDLDNIKALTAHYESVGNPGGLHVSADDRTLWNSPIRIGPSDGTNLFYNGDDLIITSIAGGLMKYAADYSSIFDDRTLVDKGFVTGITGPISAALVGKLSVSLTSQTRGDLIQYNGSNWINFHIGAAGTVLTSDGTDAVWGSPTANGLPAGGTDGQFLVKSGGSPYVSIWSTLSIANVSDITASADEINTLNGFTGSTSELNYITGVTSNIQNQLNNKLGLALPQNAIFVGNAFGVASVLAPGANTYVLTSVLGVPTWAPPTGGSGGPVPDNDYGDITVSLGGSVWDINPGVVDFVKIQAVSSGILIGRYSSGLGPIEEISIGSNLTISGGTIDFVISESPGNIAFVNSLGNGFAYSADLFYDDANKKFIGGSNSSSTSGSMTFTWGDSNINNGEFGSAMFGELSEIDVGVGSAFNAGENNYISAYGGHTMGRGVKVSGLYSWAGGWFSPGSASGKTNPKAVQVSGAASFGFYTTDSSQTDNHGVLADSAAVLGGVNPNIPSDSHRTIILGGNGIKARPAEPDQVYVPNLNIVSPPVTAAGAYTFLVRDNTTGQVKSKTGVGLDDIPDTVAWKVGGNSITTASVIGSNANFNTTLQTGNASLIFKTDSLERAYINSDGQVVVGPTSITPTGQFQVQGTGTTVSTFSFVTTNSAGNKTFSISDDGRLHLGGNANPPRIGSAINGLFSNSGQNIFYASSPSGTDRAGHTFSFGLQAQTSGNASNTIIGTRVTGTFQPTNSGNTIGLIGIEVAPVINQQSGSNGDVVGYYYNPSLTSSLGNNYAWINATGGIVWDSDITPSQLIADANDYNPSGINRTTVVKLSSDASRTITGLNANISTGTGSVDGRILVLYNVGSNNIILSSQDTASVANNRFAFKSNVLLSPNQSITLIYDSAASRWRPMGYVGNGDRDVQATTNAPSFPQNVTTISYETIKRYTNIGSDGQINISGGSLGDMLTLYLQNDSTSARTITWGTGIVSQSPTMVLTVSKETVCTFRHNGTSFLLTDTSSPL